jgi:hypothetical protein
VKWKDFVSDINLIPQAYDTERTGAIDLNLGVRYGLQQLPIPVLKTFRKSERSVKGGGARPFLEPRQGWLCVGGGRAAPPGRAWGLGLRSTAGAVAPAFHALRF